jgi:hypothetical protein
LVGFYSKQFVYTPTDHSRWEKDPSFCMTTIQYTYQFQRSGHTGR